MIRGRRTGPATGRPASRNSTYRRTVFGSTLAMLGRMRSLGGIKRLENPPRRSAARCRSISPRVGQRWPADVFAVEAFADRRWDSNFAKGHGRVLDRSLAWRSPHRRMPPHG